jgi:nucleotide-binding universal stress UspA family protein
MKNILLLAHDDAGQEARLQCALDLTRTLNGHLTCLDVTQFPIVIQDFVTTAGAMMAFVDEQQREGENAARLRVRLAAEDVSWDFVEATGKVGEKLIELAPLADAIVISTRLASGDLPDMMSVASDLALKTRAVVLAIPEKTKRLALDRPALVAWDGSGPAIAAMRAAVPLLALASSVTLFTVDEDRDSPIAEDAARYLSRHGIVAEIKRKKSDGIFTPDVPIRVACDHLGVGLCVMGAYGHSRRIEDIFGGVTRRMLVKTDYPLLIAH